MENLRLVVDNPNWQFRDPLNRIVHRRLRVWADDGARVVAVVTEAGDGMSITNAAEQVWKAITAIYPGKDVTIIEHYPTDSGCGGEHFDQVRMTASGPAWTRLPAGPVCRMLGLPGPRILHPVWGADPTPRYEGTPQQPGVTIVAADGTPLGVMAATVGSYTWGGGPGDRLLAADLLTDVTGVEPSPADVDLLCEQVIASLPADRPWTLTAGQLAAIVARA